MARWTEADIPPLDGKTALVTGANSGLGLEAARTLARHGARVLLACRNATKAEKAADDIQATATGEVEIVALDLADLASVADAAAAVQASEPRLDLLLNNAGLMAIDEATTVDGFEMQLGVNHLGHFALTAQLMPLLLATPGSRVVNMSSMGHRAGRLRLDDLFFTERGYDRWRPYFQSKLANILFTAELHRRLTEAGASTLALAAHPGGSRTDLGFEGHGVTNKLFKPFVRLTMPAAVGTLPFVRAATDPHAQSGEFYGPRWIVRGRPVRETPSRRARRADDARALWDRSEELTGLTFAIPGTADQTADDVKGVSS